MMRVRTINGYDTPAPKHYLEAAGGMLNFGAITGPAKLYAPDSHILDLLRVSTVVVDRESVPLPPNGSRFGDGIPQRGGRVVRYRYRPRLPDAFVVGAVRRASRPEVLRAIAGEVTFDPAGMAFIEAPCGRCPTARTPGRAGVVRALRWGSQSVATEVVASRRGILVVSQAWFPGWQARVDGKPAPVERVNGMLLGVPVRPGVSRVELRYEAPGFRLGMLLSVTSVLLAVFAGRFRRGRRRSSATAAPASRPDADVMLGLRVGAPW
jgi:hypothetical protein